jgi:predicted transcriptional regulator
MSTTAIRTDDELKARVAAVAERAGKTAYAFILDAITQTVERVEQDNAFQALGQVRWQAIQATGQTVPRASGNRGEITLPQGILEHKNVSHAVIVIELAFLAIRCA